MILECLLVGHSCSPAEAPPNPNRGGFDSEKEGGGRPSLPSSRTVQGNRKRRKTVASATVTMPCKSRTCSQRTLESICATASCRQKSASSQVFTLKYSITPCRTANLLSNYLNHLLKKLIFMNKINKTGYTKPFHYISL